MADLNNPLATLRAVRCGDSAARHQLLEQYMPLVIKLASKQAGRFVTPGMDEEISVGLIALNEAIDKFDPQRGTNFLGFASLVITNRLKDYHRRQARKETPASSLSEEMEPLETSQAWREYSDAQHQENRRLEVYQFMADLAKYDLDLRQLAAATPRHRQARCRALQATRCLTDNPALAAQVRQRRELPLKELETMLACSRKTLERQRKYILALFILLSGKYEYLTDYLPGGGEQ
jgi:RNA polymerase sigma factor